MSEFDLIVIGAGPGGYVAAIKAAQLGQKVACIEKRPTLGGTCLNVGCIPSKALLHSSHKFEDAKNNFQGHGIKVDNLEVQLEQMMSRKTQVVKDLTKGIESLFRKNKITRYQGAGYIVDNNTVAVRQDDGREEQIKGRNILLATGSEAISLPNISIDEKQIVSSTGALDLKEVPRNMLIIGGGVIGLEMGSVWSRLGSNVTVVEFMDRILATADKEISKETQKILEKQGLNFRLSTKVMSATIKGNKVAVEMQNDSKPSQEEYDIVLVAVGRKPCLTDLGLENVGLESNERGSIPVDNNFRTKVKNIYAIGDIIAGPMLAHKAEEEGVVVAEVTAGKKGHINYDCIASVVYIYPEVAYVGKSEEKLKDRGIEYKVGKFPFMANSRARTTGEVAGFVKILACKKTDKVLGAHMVGPHAGELIANISLGMEFKAASEDIALTSFSHPGLGEAVKEAALATYAKPIHI